MESRSGRKEEAYLEVTTYAFRTNSVVLVYGVKKQKKRRVLNKGTGKLSWRNPSHKNNLYGMKGEFNSS